MRIEMKAIKKNLRVQCRRGGSREGAGQRVRGGQGWRLGALGQMVPQPAIFFLNNVLLENSHTIIIYILSMAAIMV